MSKSANPFAVGVFVLASLVLLVVAVGALASGALFKNTATFVSYFNSSVNGLNIGAPVKFKGVRIGQVSNLQFHFDSGSSSDYIAVFYDIDIDRIRSLGGTGDIQSQSSYEQSIQNGLRASMELQSFISGVLYIDLEFLVDAPPAVMVNAPNIDENEIPVVPSAMGMLQGQINELLAKLGTVDITGMIEKVDVLLEDTDILIREIKAEELSDALITTLNAYRGLAQDGQLAQSLDQLETTLADASTLIKNLDSGSQSILITLDSTALELNETMRTFRLAMGNIDTMLAPESSFRLDTEQLLVELAKAARAMRQLAETLERNPRAILSGKPETQNQ